MVSEAAAACSSGGGSSPQGGKTLAAPYPIDGMELLHYLHHEIIASFALSSLHPTFALPGSNLEVLRR